MNRKWRKRDTKKGSRQTNRVAHLVASAKPFLCIPCIQTNWPDGEAALTGGQLQVSVHLASDSAASFFFSSFFFFPLPSSPLLRLASCPCPPRSEPLSRIANRRTNGIGLAPMPCVGLFFRFFFFSAALSPLHHACVSWAATLLCPDRAAREQAGDDKRRDEPPPPANSLLAAGSSLLGLLGLLLASP